MLRAMEGAPPDAVVFDNDGLLLDTESVWTRAERDLFERRGLEFTPADKLELVGTSAEIAGGILERQLGEPGTAAALIEELNELVIAELEHGVEAMVGARDLLHASSPTRRSPSFTVRWRSSGSRTNSTSSSAATRSPPRSPPRTPISRPAAGSGSSPGPMWSRWRTRRRASPRPAPPASR
jgi:beta-phosphoglucomutase-like phosphatase (HAD superfamily)